MNTQVLAQLGEIYRSEMLAKLSIAGMQRATREHGTVELFEQTVEVHALNLNDLSELFAKLNYSPADDVRVPSRIEKLLTKRHIPERFLFTWLNEFEYSLSRMYDKVFALTNSDHVYESVPPTVRSRISQVRQRHERIAEQVSIASQKVTEVLNPEFWYQ